MMKSLVSSLLLVLLAAAPCLAQPPSFCDTFRLEISNVEFTWQNPVGGQVVRVSTDGETLSWGLPVFGSKSFLDTTTNVPGTPISPGPAFRIGELTHGNRAILRGHAISGTELRIDIDTNLGSFSFVYKLRVDETDNEVPIDQCQHMSDPMNPCADEIVIIDDPTPQYAATTTVNGEDISFELDLIGFRETETSEITRNFISQENNDNSAFLYATLVVKGCEGGSGNGDPHFETLNGHHYYDYMGACDLKMVHAPNFVPGGRNPLTINVRTKIRTWYSYIESAAISIGEDVLEVSSFGDYSLNGVQDAQLPSTLGGFTVQSYNPSKNVHIYEIYIQGERGSPDEEKLIVRTFKDMVSVRILHPQADRFHGSSGLMGEFETGLVLARDGNTILTDPETIAQEWQVRDDEPMLFSTVSGPQYPQTCDMPTETLQDMRQLRGTAAGISEEEAAKACAKWSATTRAGCIHDVLATGDLELAEVGEL